MRVAIKVVPGASRSGIAGWLGEALKVRVSAPPEQGRANAALLEIVALALDLPSASVRIVAGAGSPRKVIEVSGLSEDEVRRRLSQAAS